jgi:hypothetical protein
MIHKLWALASEVLTGSALVVRPICWPKPKVSGVFPSVVGDPVADALSRHTFGLDARGPILGMVSKNERVRTDGCHERLLDVKSGNRRRADSERGEGYAAPG